MTKFEHKHEDIRRYAESAMSWYGRGSPIGLGIGALLLSACGSISPASRRLVLNV